MSGKFEAWQRSSARVLSGTPAQVEWAKGIRCKVAAEFVRVEAVLRAVAARHNGDRRGDMEAILEILEEKRAEVMGNEQAGYFIHDWQEIGSQVRQMLFNDRRYEAIKAARKTNEQETA